MNAANVFHIMLQKLKPPLWAALDLDVDLLLFFFAIDEWASQGRLAILD